MCVCVRACVHVCVWLTIHTNRLHGGSFLYVRADMLHQRLGEKQASEPCFLQAIVGLSR